MKNDKVGKYAVFSMIGFIICAAGLVLIKSMPEATGIMRTLPYVCMGRTLAQFSVALH